MELERAIELGKAAGVEAVNESGMTLPELLATLRSGHGAWSESASAARAHALDGVPDDDAVRLAYYCAYDQGAQERIHEIRDASDVEYESACSTIEARRQG
jgi:hypothetical protein